MLTARPDKGRPRPAAARWPVLHALDGAAVAFFLAAMGWLGVVYLRMVVSPAPQEMREGAIVLSTLALLEGRNPYAADIAAVAGNLYGILYPLLVAPAAALFGPGLETHRAVNGLFLAIAALCVFRAARDCGAERLTALLAALLAAAGWLYWVGPTVRPDGVGLAAMLGGLLIAARDPASPRRFAAVLALSCAGFAAKLYFAGGVFIVAAYVFLAVSWRRGVVFGLAAIAALALWAGLLSLALPRWAALVLFANVGAAGYDPLHLLRQGLDWAVFSLPLLAPLAVLAATAPRTLIAGRVGFWGFAALCGLAVLIVSLGGHTGAHMTYFFHLLTPPLAIAVAASASASAAARRALTLALPAAVVLNAHWFVLDPERFAVAEARFALAEAALAEAAAPLVTTEFAALAGLAGHAPVETGHSEYTLDEAGREALRAALAALLADGAFDIAIVNRNNGGIVHARDVAAAGYVPVANLPVELVWASQAWEADIWLPPR